MTKQLPLSSKIYAKTDCINFSQFFLRESGVSRQKQEKTLSN